MDKLSIFAYYNQPESIEIRDDYVWVHLKDKRIIAAPLDLVSLVKRCYTRTSKKLYGLSA